MWFLTIISKADFENVRDRPTLMSRVVTLLILLTVYALYNYSIGVKYSSYLVHYYQNKFRSSTLYDNVIFSCI